MLVASVFFHPFSVGEQAVVPLFTTLSVELGDQVRLKVPDRLTHRHGVSTSSRSARTAVSAFGDVPPDLLVGAADFHGAPTPAVVLRAVKEQPGAAGALLEPLVLRTDEQPIGSFGHRPERRLQIGEIPGERRLRRRGRDSGVLYGRSDEWPQLLPTGVGRSAVSQGAEGLVDRGPEVFRPSHG